NGRTGWKPASGRPPGRLDGPTRLEVGRSTPFGPFDRPMRRKPRLEGSVGLFDGPTGLNPADRPSLGSLGGPIRRKVGRSTSPGRGVVRWTDQLGPPSVRPLRARREPGGRLPPSRAA